ncbi:helix-turn-helix domain-containing protein [Actinomadura hibisca]|uniref:helix-turn-helix domain-containing protein n=1 Tax=Actinomadura hibisca TaxID=68565 RepID=UPI000A618D8B|nr:helix-turn-helix transcriptional regulator [Actinomadura hibisca]
MGNPPKTPESMAFGREVGKRRKRAKISQQTLAGRLNVVRSYISQVETGDAQCREDFAQRMDAALDTGSEIHSAWREFIEPLQEKKYPTYFATFKRAEAAACMLRAYEHHLVYGLFQTKAYATAVLYNPEDLEQRMARQRQVFENGAAFIVILDESVLRRLVGSKEVMREQLEHLLELSEHRNITLQVLPEIYVPAARGAFTIATQQSRGDVAYLTTETGGVTTSDPQELADITAKHATIQGEALNVRDTRTLIRKVIEELWT